MQLKWKLGGSLSDLEGLREVFDEVSDDVIVPETDGGVEQRGAGHPVPQQRELLPSNNNKVNTADVF